MKTKQPDDAALALEPGTGVKMSVLARLSAVPAATIKHYVHAGLLPEPVRTSRNMAYYDVALVPRIRRIKELQRTRFLPLKVIRAVLDEEGQRDPDETIAATIARVLAPERTTDRRTARELVRGGLSARQLAWLQRVGLITPQRRGRAAWFEGEDLEILRVLGAARRAGLDAQMLPLPVLAEYTRALQGLVAAELRLFREGVVPRAGQQLSNLTEAATALSERLIVLLRRKLLLPTLAALVEAERGGKRGRI